VQADDRPLRTRRARLGLGETNRHRTQQYRQQEMEAERQRSHGWKFGYFLPDPCEKWAACPSGTGA
jgi:hypothetical protein